MKIAIITDRYNPQINGVVTIINNLEKELTNSNIDYKIFSTYDCTNINVPFYKQIQVALNPWKLKKKFLKYSPDIVVIMTEATLGQYFKRLCVKNNIKFVTFYNTNFHLYVKKYLENTVLKLIRNFHKDSSRIFTVSKSANKFLENNGLSNISIFNVGIDANIFKPVSLKRDEENKNLMYVGRISKEKNITDFLDLRVKKNYKKIVVGDGPLLEGFRKQYPDVVFCGPVMHEDLYKFYNYADVLVFPSRTDTLGMVMIESIACGTPVAAYDCDGPRDVVINGINGFLSDDLNHAIEMSLLVSRKKCLQSSKIYSWKDSCQSFIQTLGLI